MKTLQYNSSRTFKLWAYTVSHSSLLIRSEMQYPDQENYSEETVYNIDLEFWAINYIDIPSKFNELIIREIKEQELPPKINRDLLIYDMKIFQLESNGGKYYIIAGGLLIGKNKWENKDRIFDYNSNLEHDEILFQIR
ncbi:hypothetical protein [Chryseobacterium gossypii]|uniref:hypothetical protein n=1 Tax=Chryseobacterium gossypii TaxID=3231602 RepID=UPI003525248D